MLFLCLFLFVFAIILCSFLFFLKITVKQGTWIIPSAPRSALSTGISPPWERFDPFVKSDMMLTTGPWPDGLSDTKGPSIMTVPMDKLARVRFDDAIADPSPFRSWANMWKQQLLTQDGSATLICETLAQGPIQLDVLYQEKTTQVPASVTTHLTGQDFIERQVTISHAGQVMMDNLTYISLEQLDSDVRFHLEQGLYPIGYIFDVKLTRKRAVPCPDDVLERLFSRCGAPDPSAARTYVLEIENNSCMLITETYRAGMIHGLPVDL